MKGYALTALCGAVIACSATPSSIDNTKPRDNRTPSSSWDWRLLSFLPIQGAELFRGAYVVTVESIEQIIAGDKPTGTYIAVVVNEALVESTWDWLGGTAQPSFAVGSHQVVRVSPGDGEFACQGTGRQVQPGDRVIVFPWRLETARIPLADGGVAVYAPLQLRLLCISELGGVHIEDHNAESSTGVDEVTDVTFDTFRNFLVKYWMTPEQEMANEIATRCAQLACSAPSTCFFGEQCAVIHHQAPVTLFGVQADGTNVAPPATDAGSR